MPFTVIDTPNPLHLTWYVINFLWYTRQQFIRHIMMRSATMMNITISYMISVQRKQDISIGFTDLQGMHNNDSGGSSCARDQFSRWGWARDASDSDSNNDPTQPTWLGMVSVQWLRRLRVTGTGKNGYCKPGYTPGWTGPPASQLTVTNLNFNFNSNRRPSHWLLCNAKSHFNRWHLLPT